MGSADALLLQFSGTFSSPGGSSILPSDHQGEQSQIVDGQSHSSRLCIPSGRDTESPVVASDGPDFRMGRVLSSGLISSIPSGSTEFTGGPAESQVSESHRVVTEPMLSSGDFRSVGDTPGGSHGFAGQQPVASVLLPLLLPGSSGSGCPLPSLELQVGLPVSPHGADLTRPSEDPAGGSGGHYDCSFLAEEALVLPSDSHVGLSSDQSAILSRSAPPGHSDPSKCGPSSLDCVEFERNRLESFSLSSSVVQTLMSSRKRSTNTTYHAVWKKFQSFASVHKFDFRDPSVARILDFLQSGLDVGLSFNTLKVQISALSALTGRQWSQEPLIVRFVKAAFKIRPPIRDLFPKWDLSLVLRRLMCSPFSPSSGCTLWYLTLKTVFLTAIVSARRASDLCSFSAKEPFCTFLPDRVVLRPSPDFLPKVLTEFHLNWESSLPGFSSDDVDSGLDWKDLDVRQLLLTYLQKTQKIRRSDSLFVLPVGPRRGERATPRIISSWVVKTIQLAYTLEGLPPPEGVRAHSTRAVAASWAAWSKVPADTVCRAASWATPNTFIRHYRLHVASGPSLMMGPSILNSALSRH